MHREFLLESLGSARQRLEKIQTPVEMTYCFFICRTADCYLTSPLPVGYRLLHQPPLSVMMPQKLRLQFHHPRKHSLQYLSNLPVILLQRALQHRPINRILRQRVPEDIHILRVYTPLKYQLRILQHRQLRQQLLLTLTAHHLHQLPAELPPHHRPYL